MRYHIKINFFILTIICLTSCKNSINENNYEDKENAEKQLDFSLVDKKGHNYIDNKRIIIKDKKTLVNFAEPILFDIYGKDKIISQRPYKINFIKNHWLIEGFLPKGYKGGSFLIIIDSRNGEIIKITHGK
jgi:hypothetical protein